MRLLAARLPECGPHWIGAVGVLGVWKFLDISNQQT